MIVVLILGAEFVSPQPDLSNHFVSVFVYHPASRTLHVNDTIIFADKPRLLLKLFGFKDGAITFHPSIRSSGLYSTREAPYLFRDWMHRLLRDWPFENICCAHFGIKIGDAHANVVALLEGTEPLFDKLSKKNRGKNLNSESRHGKFRGIYARSNECG